MEFLYKAIDSSGALVDGTLAAESQADAMKAAATQRLLVVDMQAKRPGILIWPKKSPFKPQRLSTRDVVAFTQSLASMLKAGVMLDQSLSILADASGQPIVRTLCSDLGRDVRAGASLAEALEAHAGLFPSYYLPMIQAGELGGSLAAGLERLSSFVERAAQIRERIVSALIYPAMLAAMIAATIAIVLTVILPRFKALFDESETKLPLATRAVIALGDAVGNYGLFVLIAAVVCMVAFYRRWHDPVRGERMDLRFLKSRWSFGLVAKIQTSRFLRTIGTLSQSGVPLPQAAGVAVGMLGNRALASAGRDVCQRLKQGESLSVILGSCVVFPKPAAQLARVGEESGRLHEMLLEAADTLDREAQGTLERLLSILVPAITIAMGAIVAALIASVLVGILSLNDLAF